MAKNTNEAVSLRREHVKRLLIEGYETAEIVEILRAEGVCPVLSKSRDPLQIVQDDVAAVRKLHARMQESGLLDSSIGVTKARLSRILAMLETIMLKNLDKKPIYTVMAATRAHMITRDLARLDGVSFKDSGDNADDIPDEISVTLEQNRVKATERKSEGRVN